MDFTVRGGMRMISPWNGKLESNSHLFFPKWFSIIIAWWQWFNGSHLARCCDHVLVPSIALLCLKHLEALVFSQNQLHGSETNVIMKLAYLRLEPVFMEAVEDGVWWEEDGACVFPKGKRQNKKISKQNPDFKNYPVINEGVVNKVGSQQMMITVIKGVENISLLKPQTLEPQTLINFYSKSSIILMISTVYQFEMTWDEMDWKEEKAKTYGQQAWSKIQYVIQYKSINIQYKIQSTIPNTCSNAIISRK